MNSDMAFQYEDTDITKLICVFHVSAVIKLFRSKYFSLFSPKEIPNSDGNVFHTVIRA